MQVIYPRILGGLTLVWAIRGLAWPAGSWVAPEAFIASYALYTIAGLWLVGGRYAAYGAWLLVLAAVTQFVTDPLVGNVPAFFLAWAGLIVAVTEGRPWERALLTRVLVSAVYFFTAAAKLNPAFLGGLQLVWIARSRSQMSWAAELFAGTPGVWLSWAAIATEFWLAVGLWHPRTRLPTAVMGAVFHLVLIPVAARGGPAGVLYLVVINVGLVASYLAFWSSIEPDGSTGSTDGPGTVEGSRGRPGPADDH